MHTLFSSNATATKGWLKVPAEFIPQSTRYRRTLASKSVLLLFGDGPRNGEPIADKFVNAGYRVAATGRSLKDGLVEEGFLNIKADLADLAVVAEVYKKTQAYFKVAPNVVVYNGLSLLRTSLWQRRCCIFEKVFWLFK